MEDNKKNNLKMQEKLSEKYELFRVLKELSLKTICNRSGIYKSQGIEGYFILLVLLLLNFLGESINHFIRYSRNELFNRCGKDAYYRLSSKEGINWRRLMLELSFKVINKLQIFSNWEKRVLIIDDRIISKRGSKIEGLSWVYDHVASKSVKGFEGLVLGWSDRSSFIPIDFALKGSKKKIVEFYKEGLDQRKISFKRRAELYRSKFELSMEMLSRAKRMGIDAGYTLFDSWYCYGNFVNKIVNEIGYNVISILKTSPKLMVKYKGKIMHTKRLWDIVYKGNQKEEQIKLKENLIKARSIFVEFGGINVKLVFCKPLKEDGYMKKQIILLSTDTSLSTKEIIQIYKQRWSVEVLFKEAKSKLFFGKYQVRNFESTICFLTLSLVRYIILSYMERLKGDFRYKGSIFEKMKYEIEEVNMLCCTENFLNLILSLFENLESNYTLFCDKLKELLDIIKYNLQILIFQRCET